MTEFDGLSGVESAAESALSSLYPHASKDLKRYVDILSNRGITWGLLGPREGDKLWARHVANSIALVDVVPEGVCVADIGSGAGLPGIPLALARPDLQVVLLEPLQRRADFLRLAVDELGVSERVSVVRSRAEEYSSDGSLPYFFEVVTCRAVAPLNKLLGWARELFLPHGQLIALKGRSAEQEIFKADKVLNKMRCSAEVLELSLPHDLEGTRAIRVRRTV